MARYPLHKRGVTFVLAALFALYGVSPLVSECDPSESSRPIRILSIQLILDSFVGGLGGEHEEGGEAVIVRGKRIGRVPKLFSSIIAPVISAEPIYAADDYIDCTCFVEARRIPADTRCRTVSLPSPKDRPNAPPAA